MSLSVMTIKTPFLNSPLISLRCEFVNKASYIKTNIFINKNCFADMPIKLINIPIKLANILIKLTDIPAKII